MARNSKSCRRALDSPFFKSFKILNENLVAIFNTTKTINFAQAYPAAFTILDRSKDFMISAFYEKIRPALLPETQCYVLMSDTDSLLLCCKSKKVHGIDHLKKLEHIMDFSNLDPSHINFSMNNAGKLGYFKNETPLHEIVEQVGLKSKSYAFQKALLSDTSLISLNSKCKGIKKAFKDSFSFEQYKRCIKEMSQNFITMYNIRSLDHEVQTIRFRKVGLSSFDDKRVLLCAIHSVPYFSNLYETALKTGKCPLCERENYATYDQLLMNE